MAEHGNRAVQRKRVAARRRAIAADHRRGGQAERRPSRTRTAMTTWRGRSVTSGYPRQLSRSRSTSSWTSRSDRTGGWRSGPGLRRRPEHDVRRRTRCARRGDVVRDAQRQRRRHGAHPRRRQRL